jgi:hypothetical protein
MIQKVDNLKEPLIVGKNYSVPCLVQEKDGYEIIIPVINHAHNDVENGQKELHYHADYRFIKCENYEMTFPKAINTHSRHLFIPGGEIRPIKEKEGRKLEYLVLPCINSEFVGITPVKFIKKSKFKHNCIHKGKCPHRGYSLDQTKAKDGIITCPLHGLQFDEKTKKIINFP